MMNTQQETVMVTVITLMMVIQEMFLIDRIEIPMLLIEWFQKSEKSVRNFSKNLFLGIKSAISHSRERGLLIIPKSEFISN